MADRDVLIDQVNRKAVVRGRVTLSSGREADYYVDMRRVTLDAEAAPAIGRVMLDLTADLEYDAVGGLTLGADPVAAAMLHQADASGRKVDAFVIRKAQKVHGLQKLIEGPPVEGRRVLAVEDTSTPSRRRASPPPSVVAGATRRRPAPRSGSTPTVTTSASGTPRTSAPSCGRSTTAGSTAASTCGSSR